MMRRRTHQLGFTLHELLLAIAIMGIITTWAATSFISVTDTWGKIRNAAELNDDATRILNRIGLDFSSVVSPRLSGGIPLRALPSSAKDGDKAVADSVVIPVQVKHETARDQLVSIAVSYHLVRAKEPIPGNSDQRDLVRTVGDITSAEPPGYPEPVSTNVTSIRFEYAGQARSESWTPDWTGTTLPKAVRVSLVLANPYRPDEAISRKAVFAIHVQ